MAQRTAAGVTWLASDHQGTAQVSVASNTNQTVTQRYQSPYGGSRGSVAIWPNKRGFFGGTQDSTGLTHLGAREYDPLVGRFASVDPVQDLRVPQQWNAYSYANNAPSTLSDPSGLTPCVEDGEDCSGCKPGCASCNRDDKEKDAEDGNSGYPGSAVGPPYSSDDEERSSTGDEEVARKIRELRRKQIFMDGKGIAGRFYQEMSDAVYGACRASQGPFVYSACLNGAAQAMEKIADEIRDAIDRIDESRIRKGENRVRDRVYGNMQTGCSRK